MCAICASDWQRHIVWFGKVSDGDLRRVLSRIRRHGAITIRDIDNDVRVEKDYAWGSRKPSKRALEAAFYKGLVTISQRAGMLKTYELLTRHFGWDRLPRAASERETLNYLLDRALRSQGIVSVESICYQDAPRKLAMRRLVESRVRRKELIPSASGRSGPVAALDRVRMPSTPFPIAAREQVHILSPFDPLIIQRKRLRLFFDYEYRFEAYVPKHKRVFGYFVCPVLIGDRIVAALDLKTDRQQQKLLVQRWHWVGRGSVPRSSAAGGSRFARVRAISVVPDLESPLQPVGGSSRRQLVVPAGAACPALTPLIRSHRIIATSPNLEAPAMGATIVV